MPDFNVRSDSVNVEQIMEQIRARIREKRGVDYTEDQIRELAAVKLQKFLDPRGVRSDLLDQFKKSEPPPDFPNYSFEENTLFESHRGFVRFMRRLLMPLFKLFWNPNPLIQALNIQSRVNTMVASRDTSRRATEALYYELIHNLVIETTRLGIEVKNLTMRVESLSSRLEFNERRARALESAVVYKPSPGDITVTAPPPPPSRPQPSGESMPAPGPEAPAAPAAPGAEGPGQRSRRRRRRRGRRGGGSAAAIMGGAANPAGSDQAPAAPEVEREGFSRAEGSADVGPDDDGGVDDSGSAGTPDGSDEPQ